MRERPCWCVCMWGGVNKVIIPSVFEMITNPRCHLRVCWHNLWGKNTSLWKEKKAKIASHVLAKITLINKDKNSETIIKSSCNESLSRCTFFLWMNSSVWHLSSAYHYWPANSIYLSFEIPQGTLKLLTRECLHPWTFISPSLDGLVNECKA